MSQSLLFEARQRRDAVIEVRNQHAARLVLHARQQLGQHHRRVRSPVAVVTAVQTMIRAIQSDLKMSIATRAENHRLFAALIHRAIADEEYVAMHKVSMRGQDLFQMRRTRLFFAFPHEANVGAQRDSRTAQRVESGQLSKDGGLVVPGRPRIDP